MSITAHVVIKNEDLWVWFAIQSVLPFVDRILVCINGSTDKTEEIVRAIDSPKIEIEVLTQITPAELVQVRIDQIKKTKTDWILILDGDEVWSESEFKKLIEAAEKADSKTLAFINKTRNGIGDVWHYLANDAGSYQIGKYQGSLNVRLIRKTEDLSIVGEYPLEAYVNKDGRLVDQIDRLKFVDCWYLHTGFLKRSSTDINKTSGSLGKKKFLEKGIKMDLKKLPEVFFADRPENVPLPTYKRGFWYELLAIFVIPLLKMKREIK